VRLEGLSQLKNPMTSLGTKFLKEYGNLGDVWNDMQQIWMKELRQETFKIKSMNINEMEIRK
jgi:hypothetical protein